MNFLEDIYPYQYEGIKEGAHFYRFISSVGGNDITKVISIRPTQHFANLFNLGFGNLEVKEDGTTHVNDSSENNNNDFDKVLASVFACLTHFFETNKDARVIFFGNTEHKHYLYKRKIGAYLEELNELFYVHGGLAEFQLEIKPKTYQVVKNGRTRNKVVKYKNPLNIKRITHLELFNPQKSKEYHFVLISLNALLN